MTNWDVNAQVKPYWPFLLHKSSLAAISISYPITMKRLVSLSSSNCPCNISAMLKLLIRSRAPLEVESAKGFCGSSQLLRLRYSRSCGMRAPILTSHPLYSNSWENGLDTKIPRSVLHPKYLVPQSQALRLMGLAHSNSSYMRTNAYKEASQRLSHVDQSETHSNLTPQASGIGSPKSDDLLENTRYSPKGCEL